MQVAPLYTPIVHHPGCLTANANDIWLVQAYNGQKRQLRDSLGWDSGISSQITNFTQSFFQPEVDLETIKERSDRIWDNPVER